MEYAFLALGDSYTIGELVPLHDNFPYQTCQLLRKKFVDEHSFQAPEIVAKTGWTTDELQSQINQISFLERYDIVTLLIGVNNQYRGRTVDNYATEFEQLLQQAIAFADGQQHRVFVLSIPDWGVTPFAEGRDRDNIAFEINKYNDACESITKSFGCTFIDITTSQRADDKIKEFFAEDGLHPSGKEYQKWAIKLADCISKSL